MKKNADYMSAIKKTRIFAVLLGSGLLGYGVMVTLQILVLPFLVRVRVAQQRERRMTVHSSFFCAIPHLPYAKTVYL